MDRLGRQNNLPNFTAEVLIHKKNNVFSMVENYVNLSSFVFDNTLINSAGSCYFSGPCLSPYCDFTQCPYSCTCFCLSGEGTTCSCNC